MITIELNLPINISLELQRVASQKNSRINRAASFTVIKLEVINNGLILKIKSDRSSCIWTTIPRTDSTFPLPLPKAQLDESTNGIQFNLESLT